MGTPRTMKPATRRRQRGVGLFDALIALAIMSFGLLAMTRFQGRMVAQTTEVQHRQVATQFAAELLSTVLVDVKNARCYTLPQEGACANAAAIARASSWKTATVAALPAPATATATLNGDQIAVVITWLGKDSAQACAELTGSARSACETRTLQTVTDVRP